MYVILIHQRYRRTDRRTTCDRNTALCTIVHRAVKTRHSKSIAKRICEQKLESSLIKSISEKLLNPVLFGIVDVAHLDYAVIVQFSGVARSRYLSMR